MGNRCQPIWFAPAASGSGASGANFALARVLASSVGKSKPAMFSALGVGAMFHPKRELTSFQHGNLLSVCRAENGEINTERNGCTSNSAISGTRTPGTNVNVILAGRRFPGLNATCSHVCEHWVFYCGTVANIRRRQIGLRSPAQDHFDNRRFKKTARKFCASSVLCRM